MFASRPDLPSSSFALDIPAPMFNRCLKLSTSKIEFLNITPKPARAIVFPIQPASTPPLSCSGQSLWNWSWLFSSFHVIAYWLGSLLGSRFNVIWTIVTSLHSLCCLWSAWPLSPSGPLLQPTTVWPVGELTSDLSLSTQTPKMAPFHPGWMLSLHRGPKPQVVSGIISCLHYPHRSAPATQVTLLSLTHQAPPLLMVFASLFSWHGVLSTHISLDLFPHFIQIFVQILPSKGLLTGHFFIVVPTLHHTPSTHPASLSMFPQHLQTDAIIYHASCLLVRDFYFLFFDIFPVSRTWPATQGFKNTRGMNDDLSWKHAVHR